MAPQAHQNTHTHTHNRFTALWILSGTTLVSRYQKKHSHTHTHRGHQSSLSAFSIYYDPWHPTYLIHMLYSLFPQSLSKFSLVYLLVCNHPLHTPTLSSFRNTCPYHFNQFPVVLRLCHLFLVSFSTLYLEVCFYLNVTHPSDHSHLCPLKCHLMFFLYRPGLTSMQLWILSGTTRVSQYQKKHSPTHTYHGHQSSLIYFLLL